MHKVYTDKADTQLPQLSDHHPRTIFLLKDHEKKNNKKQLKLKTQIRVS